LVHASPQPELPFYPLPHIDRPRYVATSVAIARIQHCLPCCRYNIVTDRVKGRHCITGRICYIATLTLDSFLLRISTERCKAVTRIYFRGVGGRHSIACMAEARRAEEGVGFLGRTRRAPSPPARECCKTDFWCISKVVEGIKTVFIVDIQWSLLKI